MGYYQGYQAMINGVTIPVVDSSFYMEGKFNVIVPGSYSVSRESTVVNEWVDINGKTHRETSPRKKTKIQFRIKERTRTQQAMVAPMMENYSNIPIKYWDDIKGEYTTGVFFMDNIEAVSSYATERDIFYDEISLSFTEY